MVLRQRNRQVLSERFSQEELDACTGIVEEAEALLQRGGNSSTPENSKDRWGNPALAKEQESILEKWAKDRGIWLENTTEALQRHFGEVYARGGETTVFLSKDCTKVYKEIELTYYVEPQLALDRIVLHNLLTDKEASLKLLGFGRNAENSFVLVVEQPFVQGGPASQDEIVSFMIGMGFMPYSNNTEFSNGDVLVGDLHDENIIKTNNGGFAIIDADYRINTPNYGLGGKRTTKKRHSF